ncbi:hypothetical protein [Streptomyces sp. I05A-00742]|uniref:hypothetical protein n=1 Tax=Streptomyces sp. I05A-00742 TaxID=2732853 RepID=UPI0020182E1A|nr:hypothetical protein [Streptomyces sp. I05A-00742]
MSLAHQDSTFINFADYPFRRPSAYARRWVDIKHLRFPPQTAPATTDAALLAALVRHEQFRDDYAGGGVDPQGTRHGPYWLARVSPEAYEPVGEEDAVRVLRTWTDQFGEVPDTLEADLRREVFDRVTAASSLHHLPDLGDDAFHDWGGVQIDFHEFVLIDRSAGLLTLLVAADD